MADAKIKFTVEGITQLHQSFQSILNDSKSLTEEWAKQGTLITKSLQEQIDLLKKRNSFAPSTSMTTGAGSQQITTEGLGDIESILETIGSDGVLIHKDSLKELANLIANTQPIDRDSEGRGGEDGRVRRGRDEEDEREDPPMSKFLRNFALTGLLRPLQSNDPLAAGIGGVQNVGTSLMAMGGRAGGIGLAIAAAGGLLSAHYQTAAKIAPTAAQASRLLGGSWEEYVPAGNETQYGLQRNEVLQRQMELAKAMGRQDLGSSLDESLLWGSSTMLSSSEIAQFARSARGDRSFQLGSNLGGYFELLKSTGVSSEKIQTQMSEYLRQIVSLNEAQLEQFGKSDASLNAGLFAMVAKALPETAESNPALVGRLAGSFYTGMSTASSKQIEALQYLTASRVTGGTGSWYQTRMMREDPFGLSEGLTDEQREQRKQYAQELMGQYRSAAGDTEQFAYLLEKQFGFKANQAYRFAESYDSGKFNWVDFEAKAKEAKEGETTQGQFRTDLSSKVDAISKMIAEWEATKIGSNVDLIKSAAEAIYGLLSGETMEKIKEDIKQTREATEEVAEAVKKGGGVGNLMLSSWIRGAHNMK